MNTAPKKESIMRMARYVKQKAEVCLLDVIVFDNYFVWKSLENIYQLFSEISFFFGHRKKRAFKCSKYLIYF